MNKELYSSSKGSIEFPEYLRTHLKNSFNSVKNANQDVEGYNRNQELQTKNYIEYRQLKRIKNFFDNFKGKHTDPSFVLNGGFEMKNWVNNELRKMREFSKLTNRNKMDTGMSNSFISTHTKDDFTNVRPSQEHSKTVDKYNPSVKESINKINKLITKLNHGKRI